jgi:hypothetical protein
MIERQGSRINSSIPNLSDNGNEAEKKGRTGHPRRKIQP